MKTITRVRREPRLRSSVSTFQKTLFFFEFHFILLTSPQGQGRHNSVSQLLWARITYPTLSTSTVGGNRNTRRKFTTFARALSILFSREDWVRVYLTGDRTRNIRDERRVRVYVRNFPHRPDTK